MEVKGLKIGFLGYCDSPSANELNCTELRRQFNVGPAAYSDAIATKDVSNLKKVVSLLCLQPSVKFYLVLECHLAKQNGDEVQGSTDLPSSRRYPL